MRTHLQPFGNKNKDRLWTQRTPYYDTSPTPAMCLRKGTNKPLDVQEHKVSLHEKATDPAELASTLFDWRHGSLEVVKLHFRTEFLRRWLVLLV